MVGIILEIDYFAGDSKNRNYPKGTFANLSINSSRQQYVNDVATKLLSNYGVFVGIATRNDTSNASTFSITDSSNNCSSFSSYGHLVEIIT